MAHRFGKVCKQAQARGSTWIKKFSSVGSCPFEGDKPDIVRQLTFYNEKHLNMKTWMHADLFAEQNEFLYEVVPGRLIRPSDIAQGPRYLQTLIGVKALKQGISLAALNLMNGRNVSHLFTSDNVLFSPEGDILLHHTKLSGEEEMEGEEYNHLAFKAWHDMYFGKSGVTGLLARSVAGRILTDKDLSLALIDLRESLANSALLDKRIITNHVAQMYPDEVTELILLINQFTRIEAASAPSGDAKRRLAGTIFRILAKLAPHGLHGIHPI